jgi:hypothetical protein
VAPAGSPNAGRLYVSYFDRPVGSTTGTDCFIRYSDDGGVTWGELAAGLPPVQHLLLVPD